MIITHTSNPSIDYYVKLTGEIKKGVQRSASSYFLAGGKGLNVSTVLDNMGIDSIATAYIGGFTGAFLKKEIAKHKHARLECVSIDEPNRINIKIRGNDEMDINDNGPSISFAKQKEMLELLKQVKENDFLVISGSLARGVGEDFLFKASEITKEHKAHLVLDIAGISKDVIAKCKPFLIKPNLEELHAMYGDRKKTVTEMIDGLFKKGVQSVLLSKGAQGAEFYCKDKLYVVSHKALAAVNTVGAGDSMLAAFIGILSENKDIKEALKWGAAAGQAAVISDGLADLKDLEKLKEGVKVEELSR